MNGESANGAIPEIVAYESERFGEIRSHTSAYMRLAPNGRRFLGSGSCHDGYIEPLADAESFLWSREERKDAIEYLGKECRSKLAAIRDIGFCIPEGAEQKAYWRFVGGEQYLFYETAFERSTDSLGNIWKEVRDRSKLLCTGRRGIPPELQDAFHAFAREIIVLRSCARFEYLFRNALRDIVHS